MFGRIFLSNYFGLKKYTVSALKEGYQIISEPSRLSFLNLSQSHVFKLQAAYNHKQCELYQLTSELNKVCWNNMLSKITKVDKERLIRSFESGQDFIHLAQLLSINENTARTIIRRHRFKLHQNSHRGHEPRLITDIYGQKLIDFVSEKCLATLKDVQIFLEA